MHAVRSLLDVKRVAPTGERELAGRIAARLAARDPARGAGDVHDRARRRPPQEGQEGFGEAYHRVEVQLHVAPHVLPAGVAEAPAPGSAGVVHQQIEAPVLGLDPLGDPSGSVLGSEVGDEDRRAAQFLREPAQPILPPRYQDQARIGLEGEPAGRRLADAARCAGDQGNHPPNLEDGGYRGAVAGVVRAGIVTAGASLLFSLLFAAPAPALPTVVRTGGPSAPDERKIAIVVSDRDLRGRRFAVRPSAGGAVLVRGRLRQVPGGSAPWRRAYRADLSAVSEPGAYRVHVGPVRSRPWVVRPDGSRGVIDHVLGFMRFRARNRFASRRLVYEDRRANYVTSEPGIDYAAASVLLLAAVDGRC